MKRRPLLAAVAVLGFSAVSAFAAPPAVTQTGAGSCASVGQSGGSVTCNVYLGDKSLRRQHPLKLKRKPEEEITQPLHGELPGFSFYGVVSIGDMKNDKRQYVFYYKSKTTQASAALYMSPNHHFTLYIVDDVGEPYPLEVNLGENGLPVNDFVLLSAGVGVASNYTLLRVSINGAQVKSMKVPFPISFHIVDPTTIIGSSPDQQFAAFSVADVALYESILSEDADAKIAQNEMSYYGLGVRKSKQPK